MTYNSTLDNNQNKASVYEIFLSAERNCHFSQVGFTPNFFMSICMPQLTTAQITSRFHQNSSCWQNQLKQFLPPSAGPLHRLWGCTISSDVAQPSSYTTASQGAACEQGEGVGTGKRNLGWLSWHTQWQWHANTEKHRPPWMWWLPESCRTPPLLHPSQSKEQAETLNICMCVHNKTVSLCDFPATFKQYI